MKNRFENAIPDMPQSFYERMERTIEGMEEPMKKRYKATTVLVATLIAALLLAGVALAAARSGILDQLFGGRAPSPEAQQLVTDVKKSVERDGVTLSIQDYVVDGDRVLISYALETKRDEALLFTSNYGTSLDEARNVQDDHAIVFAFGGSVDGTKLQDRYQGTVWLDQFGKLPTEPFDVTIKAWVMRPLRPLTVYALVDEPGAYERAMTAYDQQGKLAIHLLEEPQSRVWLADTWVASEQDPDCLGGRAKQFERLGYAQPLTELEITIKIDPARAAKQKRAYLESETTVEFSDCTVRVTTASVTATMADFGFYLSPKRAQEALMLPAYAVLDETGRDLTGGAGRLISDNTTEQAADGRDVGYWFYGVGVPLSRIPDVVVLAPVVLDAQDRQIGYDMEHAIRLQLKVIGGEEQPEDEMFYTTLHGRYYHSLQQCSGMDNNVIATPEQVKERLPCPICISQ